MSENLFDIDDENSEFNFSDEDENSPVFEEKTDKKSSQVTDFIKKAQKVVKKKPWVLAIGAAIVLIFVLLIYSFVSSEGKTEKKVTQLAPVTQGTLANQPTSIASIQTAPEAPQQAQQNSQTIKQQQTLSSALGSESTTATPTNNRVGKLEQQMGTYQQKIDELSQVAQGNAQQIARLQTTLQQMDSALQSMSRAMSSVQSEEKKVHDAMNAKASGKKAKTYYVEAIIPGRAWLKVSDGTTLTVSPGVEIPGLGRVTRIDPDSGTVKTTTGKVIRYGINEN